jgi:hypothetical protein
MSRDREGAVYGLFEQPISLGNPEVIGRNRGASALQLVADLGVALRCFTNHRQEIEEREIRLNPRSSSSIRFELLLQDSIDPFRFLVELAQSSEGAYPRGSRRRRFALRRIAGAALRVFSHREGQKVLQ